MLSFPEEFYKAEEREEFYISETMKRYWACLLDMVQVIDNACKKHGITYYAAWGTLLGAVRHEGFVPWDDDIDIMLKRPDYEKLMKVLPQEIPEGWKLSNCFTSEAHRQFFAGLSNGTEINLSKEHLAQYHQNPFVATIDICPLDYLPRDKDEAEMVKNLFILIWQVVELVRAEEPDEEAIEAALCDVEEYCAVEIDRTKPLRSQMWKLANQLVMSYTEDEGDYLVEWCTHINTRGKYDLDKHWFDKVEYYPFENIMLPVPGGYDGILTKGYGDWREKRRGGGSHNYPTFKKQIDFLKRKLAELKAEAGES